MLQIKLPEEWKPIDITPYLGTNYHKVTYFPVDEENKKIDFRSASPKKIINLAKKIHPLIDHSGAEDTFRLLILKVALIYGAIERSTKEALGIFGTPDWWNRLTKLNKEGKK